MRNTSALVDPGCTFVVDPSRPLLSTPLLSTLLSTLVDPCRRPSSTLFDPCRPLLSPPVVDPCRLSSTLVDFFFDPFWRLLSSFLSDPCRRPLLSALRPFLAITAKAVHCGHRGPWRPMRTMTVLLALAAIVTIAGIAGHRPKLGPCGKYWPLQLIWASGGSYVFPNPCLRAGASTCSPILACEWGLLLVLQPSLAGGALNCSPILACEWGFLLVPQILACE